MGHRLKARYVIHTVGPVWLGGSGGSGGSGGGTGEDELLAACYRNSIELAATHGCRTVAFPAISCGVYGYPVGRACGIAVRTVREELARRAEVEGVMLVAFEDEVAEAYERLLASQ
jgi:O-acetyl-ADP-ribose deacetylase (regulator of RNase III)